MTGRPSKREEMGPYGLQNLRAASVGYEFHHPDVDDIDFRASRTLLGKDLVLLMITGLQHRYGYSHTHRGKVSLDDDQSARINEDVARRKRELQTLLELGGTLVLFVPAPDAWYLDSGQRQYSGTGRNRQTTILVNDMDLLSVLPFKIDTVRAESREIELKTGDPFASFWRECGNRFQTAAAFREPFGETTLVIRGTETIIGSIGRVEKGLVIALPEDLLYPVEDEESDGDEEESSGEEIEAITSEEAEPEVHPWDSVFIKALFELVRALRATAGEFQQPEWAQEYLLPGEDEAATEVRVASRRLAKAQEQLDEAQRLLALREQRKTLITGTGAALETLVEEAFSALGFAVEQGLPGRSDRIAHLEKGIAVLEIKGLTKSAAEKDAAQLEKWVNEYFLEHSVMPKGILVVNGWRNRPLADRRPVFPQQMLKYSESRNHCLISSVQLLGAWLDAENHPKKRKAIAKSILSCVGEYKEYSDWSQFLTHEQKTVEKVSEAPVTDGSV